MPRQVTGARRALPLLGAISLALVAPPLLTQDRAAASLPLDAYEAAASSEGVRQTVVRPEAPLSSTLVDGASPAAQARVDALGDSRAYGSFLYPGATVLSVPGVLSGAAGRTLPGYPLIAASEHPIRPDSDASLGPASVTAKSSATGSTGSATYKAPAPGAGELQAVATASADPVKGTLEATARSAVSAVDIAGALRLSSVRASAKAQRRGGRTTSTSSLEVGDTLVGGVRVVLTPKGVTLPGQTVPLPDNSPLLDPLRQAGVSVELLPVQEIEGGVRSGGVRVKVEQRTPDGNTFTATYVFGQAVAAVTAVEAVEAEPTVTRIETEPAVIVDEQPAAGGATSAAPPGSPLFPAPLGGAVPSAAGGSAAAPQPAPVTSVGDGPAPPPELRQTAFSAIPFSKMPVLSFYVVLVVAAAAALVSQVVLRRYGVRPSWRS